MSGWGGILLIFTVSVSGACGVGSEPPVARYRLHGVVRKLDPQDRTAVIEHQKIVGFMDAMTMEFSVKDGKEFAALRSGETIDATVFVKDTGVWIGEIKEEK